MSPVSPTRTPKPAWLLEICLQEFHPEGLNPDFRKIFDLFRAHGYLAYAVAIPPRLVTSMDVDQWWERRHADTSGFNYVFVASAEELDD